MSKILCCGILARELENLLQDRKADISYLDPALHVDLDKLAAGLKKGLHPAGNDGAVLVLGTRCHPDLAELIKGKGVRCIGAGNCLEMLLGSEMTRMDSEAKTFYITGGWLENWRNIFIDGLKWDEIDARQNFGYYDRIVLLDTGLWPVDDLMILEFYEYTQVPIETIPVTLDHMRELLQQVL